MLRCRVLKQISEQERKLEDIEFLLIILDRVNEMFSMCQVLLKVPMYLSYCFSMQLHKIQHSHTFTYKEFKA